jgi:putative transposase
MDFSEFETAGQGVWNLGGIVDYAAKVALGCPISATKTARDAIAALECARDRAGELLGRPLVEDCTDPESGQLVPLVLVTDNGSCFRAGDFARHLRARPEFRHVRTRVRSPETNGQIERFFGAAKYEHLYRHEISDGLNLDTHVAVFVADYNTRRPHEAIDFQLPIDVYLADPITPVQTRQNAAEA